MCRLFGQISSSPLKAEDFLAQESCSLLRQSFANPKNLQKDGWGIGYYVNQRARQAVVVKSPRPLFEQKNFFQRLANQTRSKIIISHIRNASNPRGIPKKQLISLNNSQPFHHKNYLFAHNGTVEIPDEVFSFLGPYQKKILGKNDSEIYFWQLIKFVESYGSVPRAMKAAVQELWGIWRGCQARYSKKKYPYTGLNTLLSDGNSLYALCHYPSANKNACALCAPDRPWGKMCFTRRGPRMLVSSEPMDFQTWDSFHDPEILILTPQNGSFKITRERFSIH
ncbi:MAG: class II glutamine amidotransferase [Elusimicrobia bacterium]|nr:class II glutamine amidotransferase [Elusimicrobiota bacterium]